METCTHLQASDGTGRNDTSAVLVGRAIRNHGRFHIANRTARRRATPEAEVRNVVGDGCLALRVGADGRRVAEVVTRLRKQSARVSFRLSSAGSEHSAPEVHGRRCKGHSRRRGSAMFASRRGRDASKNTAQRLRNVWDARIGERRTGTG